MTKENIEKDEGEDRGGQKRREGARAGVLSEQV